MLMLLVLAVVLLYAHQKGLLGPYIEKLKALIGGAGAKAGGGAASGSSTGECATGGPYKGTGKTVAADIDDDYGTRHYASGKADTTTIEANAKGIAFKNYQYVVYVTVTDTDQDDTVSMKLGGTHMGSGWFDHSVGFNGDTGLGTEENHPNSDAFIVKGPNIGNIVGKRIGIAATYFKDTNVSGIWTDTGTGWKKMAEQADVGGFNPKNTGGDEAQLRIDAAKVTIHCAVVQEISGTGTATTTTTTPAPAASKYARASVYSRVAMSSDWTGSKEAMSKGEFDCDD